MTILLGNLQIFAPMVVVLILAMVLFRQYLCCIPMHHFYNKAEKDGALDDFAIAMLMTRDGRMEEYGEHMVHEFSTMAGDVKGNAVAPHGPATHLPVGSAPFVAGAAPTRRISLGGRGKKLRASFASQSIIQNIVVELAMNARQIAKVDNKVRGPFALVLCIGYWMLISV